MAKNTDSNGMIELEGRIISVLKINVPADATMEQRLQAMLDAFKTDIEAHATVTVKYSSTAQCQQQKELHGAGRFVQTVTSVLTKPSKPAAKATSEPDKSGGSTDEAEQPVKPVEEPKAAKVAKPAAKKKVEAAPAPAPAPATKAKKSLTKSDKKLLDNSKVRAVSAAPDGAVRDKRHKEVLAAVGK
jgi:hypothetical protein